MQEPAHSYATDCDRPFKVLAFYKFVNLADCAALQFALAQFCCARKIRGSFILAPEGINGTVAGMEVAIDALSAFLIEGAIFSGRLRGAEMKFSTATAMPFLRMKVRLKPEIVTLRAPQANPAKQVGTYVEASQWNAVLARKDIALVDTRNDYEVKLGSFTGATNPKTANFTEFKDFVARELDPKRDKAVAMFCTGGIRCEKASSYLISRGFEEVLHLKGGILKYLETVPEAQSRFEGECFVFDDRVSVGHRLTEGDAVLCRACRMPLTEKDRAHPDYVENVSCAYCAGDAGKHAAAEERQRQIRLAALRGEAHLGEAAAETALRNRARKQSQKQAKTASKPDQDRKQVSEPQAR